MKQHDSKDPIDGAGEPFVPEEQTRDSERDLTVVNHPPYHIVASCKTLGFHKPLDCFWSEVSVDSEHYMREQFPCSCAEFRRIGSRWSGLRASATISVYIHRCLFNDRDSSSIYRMGQCPACSTIYWSREEAA